MWQITERATGKPIGEFEYNAAYTPFYVRDGVIYFQSVATEQGSGMTSEMGSETTPFSFRAVDLKSGNLLWSRPVRDTSYRGPLPP